MECKTRKVYTFQLQIPEKSSLWPIFYDLQYDRLLSLGWRIRLILHIFLPFKALADLNIETKVDDDAAAKKKAKKERKKLKQQEDPSSKEDTPAPNGAAPQG